MPAIVRIGRCQVVQTSCPLLSPGAGEKALSWWESESCYLLQGQGQYPGVFSSGIRLKAGLASVHAVVGPVPKDPDPVL